MASLGNDLLGKKVSIIHSDHPQNWYADKIGQEFIVQSECGRERYGWVSKKDCVFVEERIIMKEIQED